jgi:hypothetical protein
VALSLSPLLPYLEEGVGEDGKKKRKKQENFPLPLTLRGPFLLPKPESTPVPELFRLNLLFLSGMGLPLSPGQAALEEKIEELAPVQSYFKFLLPFPVCWLLCPFCVLGWLDHACSPQWKQGRESLLHLPGTHPLSTGFSLQLFLPLLEILCDVNSPDHF